MGTLFGYLIINHNGKEHGKDYIHTYIGREGPLEKEMAIHSSTLAWEIPWTEEPGRPQSMGLQESDTTERLSTRTHSAELCREGRS